MFVESTDGTQVMVHDLGGTGDTLLMSHATGFHGRMWLPVARHLHHRFACRALDYRGHGDTAAPDGWQVDWHGYGDDAVAVADALREPAGIVGVGHSMGGACLLMAAHRDPTLFRGLVVFEPIIFPPIDPHEGLTGSDNPLAAGARRRRSSFPSFDAAVANYAAKPPLGAFTDESLRAYVEGGFTLGDDGHVHLKCRPEHEAATFEMGHGHRTWDVLGDITIPVWVVAGAPQVGQPSSLSAAIADRLAAARYVQIDDMDHFGPMTHPAEMAQIISDFADTISGG
jgi:pimeloyl-ACP methyl ester carboxylesterase